MTGTAKATVHIENDRVIVTEYRFAPGAMCGRLRVVKDLSCVAALVGAAMCSAFDCGSQGRWP